jgi:hypothetical protein
VIAAYNGLQYRYVSNKRTKEISTKHKEKADSSFLNDNGLYYKSVNEDDLSDIYSTQMMVFYDFKLDGVPSWWEISDTDIVGKQLKIRFAAGILPNWNVEDKNVCTTLVQAEGIAKAKIRITYRKRDGEAADNLIVEKHLDVSDLIEKIKEISERNL